MKYLSITSLSPQAKAEISGFIVMTSNVHSY